MVLSDVTYPQYDTVLTRRLKRFSGSRYEIVTLSFKVVYFFSFLQNASRLMGDITLATKNMAKDQHTKYTWSGNQFCSCTTFL